MTDSRPWAEIGTEQPSSSGIVDGLGHSRRTMRGVGLLSGFINTAIAGALVTLLLMHVWIAPSLSVLALATFIILTAAALSFMSAEASRRSITALPVGSSVNDNLPPKPMPGLELADVLRRSRS